MYMALVPLAVLVHLYSYVSFHFLTWEVLFLLLLDVAYIHSVLDTNCLLSPVSVHSELWCPLHVWKQKVKWHFLRELSTMCKAVQITKRTDKRFCLWHRTRLVECAQNVAIYITSIHIVREIIMQQTSINVNLSPQP